MKRRRKWPCNDCRVDVAASGDWYMAQYHAWEGLGLGWNDNLCIACLEKRLGRPAVLLRDIGPASSWPPEVNTISPRLAEIFQPKRPAKRR